MESEAQSQAEDFGETLNQDVTGLVVEWLILLSLCKVFYFPEKRTQGSFRLDRRKIMRLMKHWCRLPREVVDVPSLETAKLRLDRALST